MISEGSPDTEDWSNHCCTVFYSNKKDIYFSKVSLTKNDGCCLKITPSLQLENTTPDVFGSDDNLALPKNK